jgi:hypothetical protein
MAARKKSTTALAALNGDVSSSTLAKAGVEVKLTKSEIAEYIAAKAIKQIEEELAALEKKHGGRYELNSGLLKVANPPKRIKAIVNAINAANSDNSEYTAHAIYSRSSADVGYWQIHIGRYSSALQYRLIDGEDAPAEYDAWKVDKDRADALTDKHRELQKKNYKVLLVESILSGSVAGTTVLADLNKMVEQMVAAPLSSD